MSDTESKPKPKRQMTPEAGERMLANLKKGREAKARKLAEAKQKQNGNTEKERAWTRVDEPRQLE